MNRACLLLLSIGLTGCDPDSLASGERLEELMGSTPAPSEPALEVRWFAGAQRGLLVDCTLVAADIGSEEDVIWGTLSVDLIEQPEPPIWLDSDEFSWSIGLMVLVDRARYLPPEARGGDDLERLRGVWGAASRHALLYVDGDLAAANDQLLVLPDNAEPLEDEVTWVELLPAVIAAQDTFVGGISALTGPMSEDHEADEEELLPITAIEYLEDETMMGVLTGDALAGLELAESCVAP